jgi:AcrR family transcriptional regulator
MTANTKESTVDSATEVSSTGGIVNRHERVLDEAARQLNEKGVLLTSLAEIAAKLGVTRGAMYHYVADREDLVFQCYRRAAEIIARHLREAERAGGNAADMLVNFITRMLDPREPEIAARAEIAMMNQAQRDTIQGLYDALNARLAHLLETGQRQGVLRACDYEVNARVILSLVTWAPLARPWAHLVGPMGAERLRAAVMSTVLDGFSTQRQLPDYRPLDLSRLAPQVVSAFDRDAALEAKREALLRAASRAFNRKGIDSTSLEEIAAQLGTTKRTFHHHIGSKQEVVSACYERSFRIFMFIKDRMLEYSGTRLEALAASMDALARAYPNEDLTPLSPLVGYAALSPEGQAKFAVRSDQLGDAYHGLIRQGMREGSIRDVDVHARSLMLPGLLSWLVKDDVPSDPLQQQHIAREIANLVAVGLKTDAGDLSPRPAETASQDPLPNSTPDQQ